MNPCAICGTTYSTSWCSVCSKWLCERCKGDYPARVKAAAHTWVDNLLDLFRPR